MNYTSKSKNIFINLLLIIALITSVVGGAFLIIPERGKMAQASEVVNGKPADVKFISTVKDQTATDYNSTNGFTYANSGDLNYVNIKDIIYYYNTDDQKLYIDSTYQMEACDIETPTGIEDLIKTDRYSIEYNDLRYFLKDNILYSDIACTRTASANYSVDTTNNLVYIYNGSPETIINETINKYVEINGVKYYIYDNALYDDKPFVYVTGTDLTHVSGVKHNNEYTSGYIYIGQNSCEVLYPISDTTATTDGKTLYMVENVAESGKTYYINKERISEGFYDTSFVQKTLDFTPTNIVEDRDGSKDYVVVNFPYSENSNINTSFYFDTTGSGSGKTYYIINKAICLKNDETAVYIDGTIEIDTNDDGTKDLIVYKANNSEKTFTIDRNTTRYKTIVDASNTSHNYYPVEIFGNTYYAKESIATDGTVTKSSTLYDLSRTADGSLTEITATLPNNCSSATVSFSNNLINVLIVYTAHYSILYDNLYEINPISLVGRNNFYSHSGKYYYKNNNELHLDYSDDTPVEDFDYSCNLTYVEHGGVYHIVENLTFNYTVIDGKTFYISDNGELYSNIVIGGDNLIAFEDKYKVVNTASAYKVNTSKNLITIFGLTNALTIDTTDTFDGYFYGSVEIENNKKYYVMKNTYELKYLFKSQNKNYTEINVGLESNECSITISGQDCSFDKQSEYIWTANGVDNRDWIYSKNPNQDADGNDIKGLYLLLDFHDVNFDYEVNIDAGKPKTASFNGTEYDLQEVSLKPGYYNVYDNGNDITLPYYYYYNRSTPDDNGMYHYSAPSGSDLAYLKASDTTPSIKIDSNVTTSGNTVINEGTGDYLVMGDNSTIYYEFTSFSYEKPESEWIGGYFSGYKDVNLTITYGRIDYACVVKTDILSLNGTPLINGTLLINGVDPSFIFMDYSYDEEKGLVTINNKFENSTKTFTHTSAYSLQETLQYVHNMTDNIYEVIGKSGNDIKLYEKANIDADHTFNYDSEISAEFIASNVHIKYHPTTTVFDVLSNTNRGYDENTLQHEDSSNIEDGGFALLANFTAKHSFVNAILTGSSISEQTINNYYIGFNNKKSTEASAPTIDSGISFLQVQAYLNNDYVTKYSSVSSSYYTDGSGVVYGILLDINSTSEESVKYRNLADNSINVNYYWYQYIDLTDVYALVRYKTDESKFRKEKIEDASGLYTFIFQYTYINNGTATQYMYKYSVYITESSHYIEYPTFNAQLTKESNPTKDDYYEVVSEIINSDDSVDYGNYTYNNESYDIPIYIFDASRYNVSYTFKYNITQNSYTTDFVLINAGLGGEYGVLNIYKDGTLNTTYRLDISTRLINGRSHGVVKYMKNGTYYGALCITYSGDFLLSIEDFYYYNGKNISGYVDENEYYLGGRLVKNGAMNTPVSYFMCLPFEELGDYSITNKYIVANGISSSDNIGTFNILSIETSNLFYGSHTDSISSHDIRHSEVMKFGQYRDGNFILDSTYNTLLSSTATTADGKTPQTITLKYYGIVSKFIKDGSKIQFRKIDDNIYSDVSPLAIEDEADIVDDLKSIIEGTYKELVFSDKEYNIPLTNLQPVYFDYFGTFDYSNSKYYRFENCTYSIDENGLLESISFSNTVSKSEINFTNKTSISAPGFYIVEIIYGYNQTTYNNDTQYFAFVINNAAPNLQISTSEDGRTSTPFISSTDFSTTTRYTNKDYLQASWPIPNYFQGDITLSYVRTTYDGNIVLQTVNNYTNSEYISTENGKYIFTIRYGISGASYSTTYVIVDKETPDGQMYSVTKNGSVYTTLSSYKINNIFGSYAVFASTPVEEISRGGSGAKVSARISIISFNNYNNSGSTDIYNKIIANQDKTEIEAIRTDIELDANSTLFGNFSELDNAPKYNFLDINSINDEPVIENRAQVSPTQLLGNSDQSLIYIIKLYDEAGNYNIYYYMFDKSSPYMVYQIMPSAGDGQLSNIVESLENGTTQTNTNIYWGSYKAIHVDNSDTTGELFNEFKKLVNDSKGVNNNFGGIFFKDVVEDDGTHTYIYVPINSVDITSTLSVNKVPIDAKATTSSPTLRKSASIFVSKTQNEEELANRINSYNPPSNYTLTNADNGELLNSSYHTEFFKGDKNYTFTVIDVFNNSTSQDLTMNSSIAQETFFLDAQTSKANPTKQRAYNASQIGLKYKDLINEKQAFSAKVTYDYFSINPEHYLVETDANESESTYYYEYGYDVEKGEVYKYDAMSAKFKKCVYDTNERTYNYIDDPNNEYSFDSLPDSVFFVTYPFTISTNNSDISIEDKEQDENGSEYFKASSINTENELSKQGLYVFRRSYLDLSGNEITQDEIDSGNNEDLDILQDDYAVRYHVFYVDRNSIIDLTYKFNGDINPILSLGDLSTIYLGKDLSGNKEALITAETIINGSVNTQTLTTNKLKVETNLSIDKYSTIEKLQSYRAYNYDSSNDSEGAGKSYNEMIEDLSRSLNKIIFGYNISLSIGEFNVVENNAVNKDYTAYVQAVSAEILSNSGNESKINYSSNYANKYKLTIEDSSSWDKYNISSNSIDFSFNVTHTSPTGTFTTKEDDAYSSVRELSQRDQTIINSNGRTMTFVSSNVENLSFTFSDTADKYFASINPYQVSVVKDVNGSRTTILRVDMNTNNDGSYLDSFKGYMTSSEAQFRDVFEIVGDQAPYKYIINIFDKNRPGELLCEWNDDATYIVNINYIGNNPSDYTVNGNNYYSTSCQIHIDRKPPELNLKNLVQNDPNVDLYTVQKYGLKYAQLSTGTTPEIQAQYKDFLSTYAFPIRLVEDYNLEYYFKKLHPSATNSWSELSSDVKANMTEEIYTTYSTIFNYEYDDSVNIFARKVGDDPSTYRYSILPTEDEYNSGINGHLKFTESSDEFKMYDYINSSIINFSTISDPESFSNNYYEIIEKDEAGNLTRYFVYVADNTNVEVDFNHITLHTDTITTYSTDGNIVNHSLDGTVINQFITYQNTNYYLSDHNGTLSLYIKEYKELTDDNGTTADITDDTSVWGIYLIDRYSWLNPKFTMKQYYHNNTTISIPVNVTISGTEYKIHNNENDSENTLISGHQIVNIDTPTDFMNVLDMSGIHFINDYDKVNTNLAPNYLSKYVFDDYYTVNIYSVVGESHNLIIREVSDPFTTGSGHDHLESIIKKFSDFAKNNSSVYRYKFEIISRYSKTPFSIYANLPDADLELKFVSTSSGTLQVTIPDASQYNVKIKEFSVFQYKDLQWRPLNQDSNGKLIQTTNTTNPDSGLPATTYEFSEGQYRFYFSDNYSRSKTIYKVVGQNVDNSVPEFSFTKAHIEEGENTYVTSGNTILLINDEYWEAKVILKDAVKDISGNKYALVTSGNSTILMKEVNGEYKSVYYNEGAFSLESGKLVYYSMGSLFSNEACTTSIASNIYQIRVSTHSRLVYTLGNAVGTRSAYIITHFEPFSGETENKSEYEIITNWTTDPDNTTSYSITIDKSTPVITLMAESGLLVAINGQNYSKEFTISWRAGNTRYSITKARIIHSVNGKRNEITLDPNGTYDVHELGGYTLYLTDEIGNELKMNGQLGFSFNFTSKINEYFSVLIDNNGLGKINTLPSDYISTTEDGKTIRYYYYKQLSSYTPEIEIETDTTKNINYKAVEGYTDYYKIYRQIGTNTQYIICYVKIIAVAETSNLSSFMAGLSFKYTNGTSTPYYTYGSSNLITKTNWTEDQDCESFTISVYKNLYNTDNYVDYIGNKVYVNQYYNNKLVRTYYSDSWAELSNDIPPNINSNTDKYEITISATGIHSFEFYDSVNNMTVERLNITLIKDIMFTANDENPIDNRIYNGDVVLDVPSTQYYGDITVSATLNGKNIDDINGLKAGSKYTFTTSGIYEVTMKAYDSKGVEYISIYNFTIINPNVTKMTFGFGNNYGFTISKVLKNDADVTQTITSESVDSMWLTSGRPDTIGTYTITLLGYDKITNAYTPFTFVVKLNNETPSIFAVDYQFGTSTTKNITIQYNPALIYSQVGESYIRITNSDAGLDTRFEINSASLDNLEEILLNANGKYNITIYNKDDQFITNYTVTKVAPLNSSAKFIIVIVSIVVIALVVTFIILRRHTKFR